MDSKETPQNIRFIKNYIVRIDLEIESLKNHTNCNFKARSRREATYKEMRNALAEKKVQLEAKKAQYYNLIKQLSVN